MNFQLGIKTDPIENRYSFQWLFDLLAEEGVRYVQLGSSCELYWLEDEFFDDLRLTAATRNVRLKSVFSSHREFSGFFSGNVRQERAARRGAERLLEIASIVGADYVGSNAGSVYRDRPDQKIPGMACYLRHLQELSRRAHDLGLQGLTIEPMSCLAEPPSTPVEIEHMCGEMADDHRLNPGITVPTYLCADISHGLCDANRNVVHTNLELFTAGIPYTCEFHFKNTDSVFGATFGFNDDEQKRGIVNLAAFRAICDEHQSQWPVDEVVGYLEIGGPKTGRDYTDPHLGHELRTSLRAIKTAFFSEHSPIIVPH